MGKRRNLAKLITIAVVIGATFPVAQAAQEDPMYSMEQVTVTAMRDKSPDLTTPAYVHILTQEQLQATGATSLIEVLKFQEGISYSSQNPQGHSGGGMSSRLIIRGVEKGTLVMVNGVPVNLNGWYQLDSIPLSNIDKVEIVSGGASVMYGSEAFGGVINIITKKKVENSVSTSFGNYGLQQHNLNMQMGKLAFSGQYSEVGTIRNMTGANGSKPNTAYYTNFDGDQLTNVAMTYVFDPHFTLRHEYTEDHIDRSYHFALNDNLRTGNTALMHDVDKKNLITALYENNALKMTAYYNQRKLYDEAKLSTGLLNGAYTDTISELGSDIQNSWQTGFGKLLAGVGSQHETYQKEIHNGNQAPIGSLSRDNYSFYLQSTHALNPRDTIILGGRQEWVQAENNNNHSEFLPQVQFLRRISDNQS
jgi:vitamin B12 transporter